MKSLCLILFLFITTVVLGQNKWMEKEGSPAKLSAIEDRAAGIHNAGNIGLFFENRGKLYPRRITQGPSGEFPINSTKHYIFRINQMVGIPGNVVQSRYTDNEEWEAVGGFHNPDLARVAMSDNPSTWHPENGWPVKDENGIPVFKSDQDSYCVYNDLINSRRFLNLELAQTGYIYGVKAAQNIIFFKYELTNKSSNTYDSLYFGLYTDIDVGNISGGVPEYGDDKIGFDKEKNFLYFYDDGISQEWPDYKTGYFGITFLKTPSVDGEELGITDMHYNLYFNDEDQDTIQYGIMSSAQSLYNSPLGERYFHPGDGGDIHFDDPATIPDEGLDIVANIASGPYRITPGETLVFLTAMIAGETLESSYESLAIAESIVNFDFDFIRPPENSSLSGVARDSRAYLYWDDHAELSYDKFIKEYDFEGYRLYRSNDKGLNWVLLADYDIKNFIGNDTGLEYSLVDSTIINGFEYWYTLTAYDRGSDIVGSLESPKGTTENAVNLVALTPQSDAIGYVPVSTEGVSYVGKGISNYQLNVNPVDKNALAGNKYRCSFDYTWLREIGEFYTEAEFVIKDSTATTQNNYRFEFLGPDRLQIVDLNTGDYLEPTPKSYFPGATYNLNDGLAVKLTEPFPDDINRYPDNGDVLTVSFAQNVVLNSSDTVVNHRPFDLEQLQSTPDGVSYQFIEPEAIKDVSKISGDDDVVIEANVVDDNIIENQTYLVTSSEAKSDNSGQPYIVASVKDESQNEILKTDYYSGQILVFGGLEVVIDFNESDLPTGSNIFSITTQQINTPNLQDAYLFSIKGSAINQSEIKNNLEGIKVVPNPYIVSSRFEPEFGELRREPLRQIQFINLPNECTIYIFSVDADLVKTLHHQAVSGTAIWDLRAEGGREVATGIYMYVVKTNTESFKDRFAIIK